MNPKPFELDDFTRDTIRRHFRRKGLEWTEGYFLDALESSNKYDVYWATIALRDCGTARAIPALKAKLGYPMQDVKCTSILTIAHLAGASETPFYIEALESPAYREKDYAIWAIRAGADARAVDAVLSYLRKNRSRLVGRQRGSTVLADGIEYLYRHAHSRADVQMFLGSVREGWQTVPAEHRAEIVKRVPEFDVP